MLNTLSPELQARLRSGVAISSVTQCVEELVLNALDAGAICVAVRVDLAAAIIQVVDNGCGISHDELEKVANRYMTSKCHSVADLDNLCHFGYRGEALASMRDICLLLEIDSRAKTSFDTFTRVFHKGTAVPVSASKSHRPSAGTTITVHDLFHKLPVRQRHVNPTLELERVRQCMEALALIHPNISISLRNDATNQKIMQTTKTSSVLNTFRQIYGSNKSRMMIDIARNTDELKVQGYLSMDSHHSKALQFVYINGRRVLKTKMHKLINNIISKSSISRQKGSPRFPLGGPPGSPVRASERYGMFVMNITCPLSVYDITYDPAKTLVEFRDWDQVLGCIQTAVEETLIKEGLIVREAPEPVEPIKEDASSLEAEDSVTESPEAEGALTGKFKLSNKIDLGQYGARISTWNSNNSRQSVTVRRPQSTGNSQEEEGMEDAADNTELSSSLACTQIVPESSPSHPGQLLAAATKDRQPEASDLQSETPLTKLYLDASDTGGDTKSSNTDSDRSATAAIGKDADSSSPCFSMLMKPSQVSVTDTQPGVRDRTFISLEPTSSNHLAVENPGKAVKNCANNSTSSEKLTSTVTSHAGLTPLLNLRHKLTNNTSLPNAPSSLHSFRHAASQKPLQVGAGSHNTPDLMKSLRNLQARWRRKRKSSELRPETETKLKAGGKPAASVLTGKSDPKDGDDIDTTTEVSHIKCDLAIHSSVKSGGDNQNDSPIDFTLNNGTLHPNKSQNCMHSCDRSGCAVESSSSKHLSSCSDDAQFRDCAKGEFSSSHDASQHEGSCAQSSSSSTGQYEGRSDCPSLDIPEYDKLSYGHRKRKSGGNGDTLSSKLSRLRCVDCHAQQCHAQQRYSGSDPEVDFKFTPRPMVHHDSSSQDFSRGKLGNFLTTESLVQTAQTTDFTSALNSLGSSQDSDPCSLTMKPENPSPTTQISSVKFRLQKLCRDYGVYIDTSGKNLSEIPSNIDWCRFRKNECDKTDVSHKPDADDSSHINQTVVSADQGTSNIAAAVKSNPHHDLIICDASSKTAIDPSTSSSLEEFRQSQFRKIGPPKLPCFKSHWINKSTKLKMQEGDMDSTAGTSATKLGASEYPELCSQSAGKYSNKTVSKRTIKPCDNSSGCDEVPPLLSKVSVPGSSSEDDAYSVELGSQIWSPMDVMTPFLPKHKSCSVPALSSPDASSHSLSSTGQNTQGFAVGVSVSSQCFSPECNSTQPFAAGNMSPELNDSGIVPDLDLRKASCSDAHLQETATDQEKAPEVLAMPSQAIETELNPQFAMVTNSFMKEPSTENEEDNNRAKPLSSSMCDGDTNLQDKILDYKLIHSDSEKAPDKSNLECEPFDKRKHDDVEKHSNDISECSAIPNVAKKRVGDVEVSSASSASLSSSQLQNDAEKTGEKKDDDIIFTSTSWICRRDPNTGKKQYINRISGCSSFEAPGATTGAPPGRSSEDVLTGTRGIHHLLSSTALEFLREVRQGKQAAEAPSTWAGSAGMQSMLHRHQDEDADTEAGVKWRQGQPQTGPDIGESLVQLWTEWEDAIEAAPDKNVLNVAGSSSGRQAVMVGQAIHPYTFSHDSVARLKVLGQLDNKFIMCLLPSAAPAQQATGLSAGDILVVVDQHAAHERVRLEKLTSESVEEAADGQTCVKSCPLGKPIELTLAAEDVRIMEQYAARFTSIGISFNFVGNGREAVSVTDIPACFMNREASEQRRGRPSVATDKIEMLLKRQVELLRSTHGASGPLPREIHDVLCSQACHGAIKFGDALSQKECEQLIEWLSHCKLPFQCAHGRPSIIPLINMQHLCSQFPEQPTKKPRLYRLRLNQSETI